MSTEELQPADPDEVDRKAVMAIGDCPNCGDHKLATVKVEDATYISSCSMCEYEQRAPVMVNEDGKTVVPNDQVKEFGLEQNP